MQRIESTPSNEINHLNEVIKNCLVAKQFKIAATLWHYAYELISNDSVIYGLDRGSALQQLNILKKDLLNTSTTTQSILASLLKSKKTPKTSLFMIRLVTHSSIHRSKIAARFAIESIYDHHMLNLPALRALGWKPGDWRGIEIPFANIPYANFSNIDITGADLRGANLAHANLTKANCDNANLSCVDWNHPKFLELDPFTIFPISYSPHFTLLSYVFDPSGEAPPIYLIDLNRERFIGKLKGHTGPVRKTLFSPCGNYLASCSMDKTVRIWSIEQRSCEKILKGHSASVETIAYSKTGQFLASGSYDKTVKIWLVSTGTCIKACKGHTSEIKCLAFSPNGYYLASVSIENGYCTIGIWAVFDTQKPKIIRVTNNHFLNRTINVAFSAQSDRLVSQFEDSTIRLWSIETGECLAMLAGCTESYWSVQYYTPSKLHKEYNNELILKFWSSTFGHTTVMLKRLNDRINIMTYMPYTFEEKHVKPGNIKIWNFRYDDQFKISAPLLLKCDKMQINNVTGVSPKISKLLKKFGAIGNVNTLKINTQSYHFFGENNPAILIAFIIKILSYLTPKTYYYAVPMVCRLWRDVQWSLEEEKSKLSGDNVLEQSPK